MRKDRRDPNEIRELFLMALGCGVFAVWMMSVTAYVFAARPVDLAVHGIMATVCTSLFGGALWAGRKANGNGNGKGGNGAGQ